MKYKLGDLLEDGIGKLWLVTDIKKERYIFQKCENPKETWEDYIASVDQYRKLTKVSL